MCKVWAKGKHVQCRGVSDFLQHGNLRTEEVEGLSEYRLDRLREKRAEAESQSSCARFES
jgi:hypothetical protein